jgi:cytochrome c
MALTSYRRQSLIALWTLALLLAPLAAPAWAGEEGGALFVAKGCHRCHSAEGRAPSLSLYPRLAGQNGDYAFQQMRDIRDGRRANAMSVAMRATVTQVSDAQFRAIAQWLADL